MQYPEINKTKQKNDIDYKKFQLKVITKKRKKLALESHNLYVR